MKYIVLALALLLALASAQDTLQRIKCTCDQKKATVCPMIYSPVVGEYKDSSYKSFSNSCQACSTKGVSAYYQFRMCSGDYQVGGFCTAIYDPVCGVLESGELKQFGNECEACSSGETTIVAKGLCPNLKGGVHA